MEHMEITFLRTATYTVTLNADEIKGLLREIRRSEGVKLSDRDFRELIEGDQLLDEHGEGVASYVMDRESDWEVSDNGNIEDLEIVA